MTQEEKDLILKDLRARLKTGTYVVEVDEDRKPISNAFCLYEINTRFPWRDGYVKMAYLRPLSSMTKDEWEDWESKFSMPFGAGGNATSFNVYNYIVADFGYSASIYVSEIGRMIDWLNEHHFDYRGLIPMGLALEARPDMYN